MFKKIMLIGVFFLCGAATAQAASTESLHSVVEPDPNCGECAVPSALPGLMPVLAVSDQSVPERFLWDVNEENLLQTCGWSQEMVQSEAGKKILAGLNLLAPGYWNDLRSELEFKKMQDETRAQIFAALDLALALTWAEQGQSKKADKALHKILKRKADARLQVCAHYALARLAQKNNHPAMAREHYQQISQLVPPQTPLALRAARHLNSLR